MTEQTGVRVLAAIGIGTIVIGIAGWVLLDGWVNALQEFVTGIIGVAFTLAMIYGWYKWRPQDFAKPPEDMAKSKITP